VARVIKRFRTQHTASSRGFLFSGFGGVIYEVNEFSIRLGSDIAAETKLTTKQPLGTYAGVDCVGTEWCTLVGFRSIPSVLTIPLLNERDFIQELATSSSREEGSRGPLRSPVVVHRCYSMDDISQLSRQC